MRIKTDLIVAAALWIGGAGVAQAGACGYEFCWGAVGSSADGAYGWAHSYSSEDAAYNAVYASCEGDCTEIETFYNACGAMARASNGAWGWASDATREKAENRAVGYCLDYGSDCAVVVWACSQ